MKLLHVLSLNTPETVSHSIGTITTVIKIPAYFRHIFTLDLYIQKPELVISLYPAMPSTKFIILL